jgi:predicted RNase H-like nuclease (RuvC/YqgF family)
MDRVAEGLQKLGRKANQALDETKLRMELLRVRRRMDGAARDLGYVTYRQAKGESAPEGEIESLTRRISEAEAEAKRLQDEIDKVRDARREPGQTKSGPAADDATSPPS